jgi:hypothetical protein
VLMDAQLVRAAAQAVHQPRDLRPSGGG